MALKGTLRDFSVADIFQLIGQQQKSGALHVKIKEKEAQILFDAGRVVLGTFSKGHDELLLGTMLLRAGVINSEQLDEALRTQKTTLRSLGEILKSMGAIKPTVLSEFFSLQLKEVLFRLFQWKDGLYEFAPGKISYNKTIIRPQSSEGVVMDGFRMLDEWAETVDKVGTLEGVFRPLVDPEQVATQTSAPAGGRSLDHALDDAFSEFDDRTPSPATGSNLNLTPEELNLLRLLDGQKSLQEIIYLSRMGTFETCKAMATLIQRKLAEKVSELSQTRVSPNDLFRKEGTWGQWISDSWIILLVMFIFCMALPVLGFGIRSNLMITYGPPEDRQVNLQHSRLDPNQAHLLSERMVLQLKLDLYRLENRSFPISLDELNLSHFVRKWNYESNGTDYILRARHRL